MKPTFPFLLLLVVGCLFSCSDDDEFNDSQGFFAIANRVDGTVSIYSASTQQKIQDIVLPD
ncbi:MAG: hypothetical protein KTR13_00270, partial [Saprospiraceae bacterium]|nr:hypothetical protein [Saprospiraceae bacterium]